MPALTKRMLIDATHSEEMRVAIVDQSLNLEHLDIVHAGREPLKGNIYLARVRRIEPSLQAAFVEYDHEGEKRHGFLSFAEIHPDYFRIPVADRDALREALAKVEAKAAEAAARGERLDLGEGEAAESPFGTPGDDDGFGGFNPINLHDDEAADDSYAFGDPFQPIDLRHSSGLKTSEPASFRPEGHEQAGGHSVYKPDGAVPAATDSDEPQQQDAGNPAALDDTLADEARVPEHAAGDYEPAGEAADGNSGEDELEEQRRRVRRQFLRNYRIQEVVKRGQVMLIQVVKEERGNKGAALTTYMSLAGRYCVLMPNSDRSGGVSRKISNPGDRRRLKETLDALNMPDGMSVILRTAGVERSADEIKRDYEYLARLWDQIRDTTMQSVAPALIYEEANLIKRAIRDHFARDVDGIVVQGESAFKAAKAFIRLLMPSHEDRVVAYSGAQSGQVPLFTRYQVESQIEKLYEPVVQLKSGGYLVVNPTEALISIDVNSGRATRDRHIEDTALRTNLEAAEEVARQLKLRDFAGLVVIDFIDMEDGKHNQQVERKMKEATRGDRARLQIGRISGFGLMEMSRQRLRPSLLETNFEKCPHCAGAGHVRSADSAALSVLRAIEDEGLRGRTAELAVDLPTAVALYILNEKRDELNALGERYDCKVYLRTDDALLAHEFKLTVLEARSGNRLEQAGPRGPAASDSRKVFTEDTTALGLPVLTADDLADKQRAPKDSANDNVDADAESDGERTDRTRNRRTRGRTRKGEREPRTGGSVSESPASGEQPDSIPGPVADTADADAASGDKTGDKRRRNRRGGSRRRGGRNREDGSAPNDAQSESQSKAQPAFGDTTVLEIDTTPRRGPRRSKTDAAAVAVAAEPKKVGWWRRWTGV